MADHGTGFGGDGHDDNSLSSSWPTSNPPSLGGQALSSSDNNNQFNLQNSTQTPSQSYVQTSSQRVQPSTVYDPLDAWSPNFPDFYSDSNLFLNLTDGQPDLDSNCYYVSDSNSHGSSNSNGYYVSSSNVQSSPSSQYVSVSNILYSSTVRDLPGPSGLQNSNVLYSSNFNHQNVGPSMETSGYQSNYTVNQNPENYYTVQQSLRNNQYQKQPQRQSIQRQAYNQRQSSLPTNNYVWLNSNSSAASQQSSSQNSFNSTPPTNNLCGSSNKGRGKKRRQSSSTCTHDDQDDGEINPAGPDVYKFYLHTVKEEQKEKEKLKAPQNVENGGSPVDPKAIAERKKNNKAADKSRKTVKSNSYGLMEENMSLKLEIRQLRKELKHYKGGCCARREPSDNSWLSRSNKKGFMKYMQLMVDAKCRELEEEEQTNKPGPSNSNSNKMTQIDHWRKVIKLASSEYQLPIEFQRSDHESTDSEDEGKQQTGKKTSKTNGKREKRGPKKGK